MPSGIATMGSKAVWDHAADKCLLLSIIEAGALTKIDWHDVSEKLSNKGYNFTHEAARQHYQKIRKESREAHPSTGTPGGSKSTAVRSNPLGPTTPSKNKVTKSSASTPSSTARRASSFKGTKGKSGSKSPVKYESASPMSGNGPATPEDNDDDDGEDYSMSTMVSKNHNNGMSRMTSTVKYENDVGFQGQTAPQFKIERQDSYDYSSFVDLDDDSHYA